MKKFLLIFLICFIQNIFSQNPPKDVSTKVQANKSIDSTHDKIVATPAIRNNENIVYNTAGIQVKPEFPGGQQGFERYIKENFKSPDAGLKGKIYTTFIIEKDGSLSDIKILRDLGHGTGEEAIRVLKNSPKWIPGKQNDKEIRVLYSVPIYVN